MQWKMLSLKRRLYTQSSFQALKSYSLRKDSERRMVDKLRLLKIQRVRASVFQCMLSLAFKQLVDKRQQQESVMLSDKLEPLKQQTTVDDRVHYYMEKCKSVEALNA